MDTVTVLLLLVAAAAVAFAVYFFIQKERTQKLRSRFGPEYQRAMEEHGSRSKAESALAQREKRVEKFKLRPLQAEEQRTFAHDWHEAQTRFVDDPAGAVDRADVLIARVMKARGYPMGDFDQRVADVSVDHANVVRNYRSAHEIAISARDGRASTEDLRRSMVYYRELFEDLLESRSPEQEEARR